MRVTDEMVERAITAAMAQARRDGVAMGDQRWDGSFPTRPMWRAAIESLPALTRPPGEGREADEVVGHKTLRDESGRLYHEPLTRSEADRLMRDVEEQEARRNGLMPNERAAICMFFDAWVRLKDFGWREAIYCPKDGSHFLAIEPGCTAMLDCTYEGEWPKGSWWAYADGDCGPSHPALFKPKESGNDQ